MLLTWRDISDALVDVVSGKDLDESTRVFVSHFAEHINEAVEMEFSINKIALEKQLKRIDDYVELYLNKEEVDRDLNKYLKAIISVVLEACNDSDSGPFKPKYWKAKPTDHWTRYAVGAALLLVSRPELYCHAFFYIEPNEKVWKLGLGGSLPLDVPESIIVKAKNAAGGELDTWLEPKVKRFEIYRSPEFSDLEKGINEASATLTKFARIIKRYNAKIR